MNNAIKKLIESGKWQPIETAPRDATVILGKSEYSERIGTIRWMEIEGSVLKGHWSGIGLGIDKPTHWMPIPTGNAGYDAKDDLWLFNVEYKTSHDGVIGQYVEFIKLDDRLANALEIAVEALQAMSLWEDGSVSYNALEKIKTIAETTNDQLT